MRFLVDLELVLRRAFLTVGGKADLDDDVLTDRLMRKSAFPEIDLYLCSSSQLSSHSYCLLARLFQP